MIHLLAYIASWGLYFIGDLISKIMNTRFTAWLYPIYNWCMTKSSEISDQYKLGVWEPIKEDKEDEV